MLLTAKELTQVAKVGTDLLLKSEPGLDKATAEQRIRATLKRHRKGAVSAKAIVSTFVDVSQGKYGISRTKAVVKGATLFFKEYIKVGLIESAA